MDVEAVFDNIVGGYGPYQRKILWCVSLTQIFSTFHSMHMVFIGAQPKFYCVNGNDQIPICPTEGQSCDEYIFPGDDFTSIVSEWNLVCDKYYQVSSVQSLFMAGVLIGCILFGNYADKHGRHFITWSTLIGMFIFSMCGTFTRSYNVYATMRFLTGVVNGGYGVVSFVLVTELLGQGERSFCGIVIAIISALSIVTYAALAYMIRDWRQLSFVTALPGVCGLFFKWFLPESPRWLASSGRKREAEVVLTMMAKKNNRELKEPILLKTTDTGEKVTNYNIDILLTHPVLRSRFLVSIPSWFVFSLVYYGMTMSAGSLGQNLYVSVCLSGLVEIPANISTLLILDRLGRRRVLVVAMFISGTACAGVFVLQPDDSLMQMILGLIGKMAISVAFAVAYIYAAELYPTVIRNNALGMCSTASRIGGITAPMLVPLTINYPGLEYLIYAVSSFIIVPLTLKLPETTGKVLPETPDDL